MFWKGELAGRRDSTGNVMGKCVWLDWMEPGPVRKVAATFFFFRGVWGDDEG